MSDQPNANQTATDQRSPNPIADTAFSLADLDYELPESLIAQVPPPRREDARLLIVDRATQSLTDSSIADLPAYLTANDLLVLNDTRVLRAKFTVLRQTGGRIPGLFLTEPSPGIWQVMLRGATRVKNGEKLTVEGALDQPVHMTVKKNLGRGRWLVHVDSSDNTLVTLEKVGSTPLPPYIRRDGIDSSVEAIDRTRYQTVYAKVPGAVAAPTAGLHLTNPLLEQLAAKGVLSAFVTLHVGLGTFKPITAACPEEHKMHTEWYHLPDETADAVNQCRQQGGRTIAVGTTSVRTLEAAYLAQLEGGDLQGRSQETALFIYPPYQFNVVNALLTNFHLPGSTLLALVMALTGIPFTRRVYQHAIAHRYRFFSYGDAMLIV